MKYAIIENQLVVNIAIADEQFASSHGWIACSSQVDIGWGYSNGQFTEPVPPVVPPEQIQAENKSTATLLLQDTDWATLQDIANGSPKLSNQAEFLIYRNAVRSIAVNPPTTKATFPSVPTAVWVD